MTNLMRVVTVLRIKSPLRPPSRVRKIIEANSLADVPFRTEFFFGGGSCYTLTKVNYTHYTIINFQKHMKPTGDPTQSELIDLLRPPIPRVSPLPFRAFALMPDSSCREPRGINQR